jgi:TP901 family phage tail tape measure protein
MDAGLIAMRMRLSGGSQVAGEAGVADAAIEKTAATTEAASKRSTRAASGIRRSLTNQISAMRSIGRGMTKYVTAPILGVAAVSGKFALDFDRNMRNVNSIAQLPERQFKRLKQSVLDLAGPTAQTPNTLAEGLYDLVSSGFNADESLVILKRSALAASAGLTTTEVATKAVAAALNAYELPASRAGKVSDQLFETVNRGVLTFDQLATTIGDVLPFASQLHVGLDQVGAAISTMTKGGLSSAESTTRLKNVLVTLIKPQKDLSKLLKEMGTTGAELVEKKGLQGALEAILARTDGTKESVAALFPNIRALGGVLALTGIHAKSAAEDVAAFKDTTGATAKVLKEQEKSFGFQIQRAWASLQAVLIEIGTQVLPIVVPPFLSLLHLVGGVVHGFAELPGPVKAAAGELAVLAALAGPLLLFASAVLTAAKNLGILQATEAGTTLNKGKIGRLGAGVAGVGAMAAGQAVGGTAGEAIGNIGGGAALGFSVGGPWGAAAGGALGAALTFGPALLDLFDTEKKMNPLQEKLAASVRGMGDAFRAARAQVRSLKASEDAVERTRRRHKEATKAVERAQDSLNAARRRAGPNSRAAIQAEVRYGQAIRGVTRARNAQKRAERQHGQELQTTKELLRFAVLEERHRINVLRDSRRELSAQRRAMKANGASLQELQPINEKLGKNSDQLRSAQKRQAETMLEAAKVAGGKYATFLRSAGRSSIEYGSKVKATKEQLRTMKTTLGELVQAIQRTDDAFEAGVLGSKANTLRDGIEGAEEHLKNLGGGAPKPGGAPHRPAARPRKNTTQAEPTGGSAGLERLLRDRRRRGDKTLQPVQFVVNKRVLAEGVVEIQEGEDARA